MKYFLIVGEASGDLHGSKLIRRLFELDKNALIQAWGGDLMSKEGATILKHYQELAFMGFAEVIANIGTIYKNFKICKSQILAFNPDAIIFVDYPGFNLRMAQWAKKADFKTFYYISPQLWAWKEGRVKHIKSSVDQLYTILPFENNFYKKYEVYPEYVGHPLLEAIAEFTPDTEISKQFLNKKILALLPGSRKQEISKMLPLYLKAAKNFPDYTPVIAAAPSLSMAFYESFLNKEESKSVIFQGKTYSILAAASLAWVSSGTATLETALFGVPQIVCYTGNRLSYLIAKKLIKVKYISLVNLILDKPLLKELIQDEFTVSNLVAETNKLDSEKIKTEYFKLHDLLLPDNASFQVANSIISKLKSV